MHHAPQGRVRVTTRSHPPKVCHVPVVHVRVPHVRLRRVRGDSHEVAVRVITHLQPRRACHVRANAQTVVTVQTVTRVQPEVTAKPKVHQHRSAPAVHARAHRVQVLHVRVPRAQAQVAHAQTQA